MLREINPSQNQEKAVAETVSADTAADEGIELMVRLFNIADDAKSEIMKAIYA